MSDFLLVHSPLVGPFSWVPAAGELERRGHRAIIPDLRDGARGWRRQVELAVAAAGDAGAAEPIICGHSGAGVLLPAISAELPATAFLFVDAVLPKPGTSRIASMHPAMRAHLTRLASDGLLPPWHEWWGEATLKAQLPSDDVRSRFVAELRPVPLAVLDEVIPEVGGWPPAPCAYLRLSEAYELEEADAARQGWPVTRLAGGAHLDTITRPGAVVDAMFGLLARLDVDHH